MGHEKEVSRTTSNPTQEPVKDAKDVSNVLLILDSQPIRTNPFGANVSGENSYRRAERISAALHLVTNHVPEDEPLRTVLRNKGLELLSIILELRSGFRGPASEKGQVALASIRELISLIRVLAVSGYISVQNANAIAEAIDELGSLIVVSQRSALAEQLTISHEQLIPPVGSMGFSKQERGSGMPVSRAAPKRNVPQEGVSGMGVVSNQRGERIIDILKSGGILGIRDISANLPQYSEKMIQRELADLVETGKVRKLGAKRWSRYQLG
ncbi:MAG: hypothetical protein A2854_04490 [Parcubacteria group bacterium RIFCSPHIGHO2_01_FULL_56_18]|nr:MAG: hypothetical protein A2854_04490 [Parcubacteria group bacterium RIFCSPHIGHO2_01_FULL_56_18]